MMKKQHIANGYKFSFQKQEENENQNAETPTFVSIQINKDPSSNPSELKIKHLNLQKRKYAKSEIKILPSSSQVRIQLETKKFYSPKKGQKKNDHRQYFHSLIGKNKALPNQNSSVQKKFENKMKSYKYIKNKNVLLNTDKIFFLKKNLVDSTFDVYQKEKQTKDSNYQQKKIKNLELDSLSFTHQTKWTQQSPKSLKSASIQKASVNLIEYPYLLNRQLFPSTKYAKQLLRECGKLEKKKSIERFEQILIRKRKPLKQNISKISSRLEKLQMKKQQYFL